MRFYYVASGGGMFLTIHERDTNRSVFLQGDEAVELYDRLESCRTERQVQAILSDYSEVMS